MQMPQDVREEIVALLPRLLRFAYALTGAKEEAEDVVQSACERALARLDQFTPGTRLDSWMFKIVHSVTIDRVRRRRRLTYMDPAMLTEMIADDARILERTAAREELAVVHVAMAALPDEQRIVLAMVALEGLPYQDVAEALGIPIGTVMSRLSRARRKLAEATARSLSPTKGSAAS